MLPNPIRIDPEVQGGVACFAGTRVPVEALLDHLQQGSTIDEFLADFPTVSHDQVVALLEMAKADVSQPSRARAQ